MQKLIFHIDVNSAFLSWEAAKRIAQGEEDIRLIPSAIGGDREKRTGVILAKSIPAKKFGIKTGEPVGMALRKCPDLFLARPDFILYETCSRAFMDICREYAPVVEKYSIDECFLDMSGTQRIYPDPVAIACTIKDRIFNELGFTVNVGISDCKVLAKMASDFEKPNKVHTLYQSEISSKMWPLPIRELFSVGTSTAEKLEKAGIRTIGDLAKADLSYITHHIGAKAGKQIHDYANGIDKTPVLAAPELAKGYSNSTTLETDIITNEQAYKVLLALTDSVAARMRADKVKAYCIGVTIRSNNFKTKSHQITLTDATDITKQIYQISKSLFDELWDGYTPIRLLGVSLTNIATDTTSQLCLFENNDHIKASKLDKATDTINNKFGAATIVRGSSMHTTLTVGKKHKAQMMLKTKQKEK